MAFTKDRLRKLFEPYLGQSMPLLQQAPQTKEILCVTSRLRSFESLVGLMTLDRLGALVDRYYGLIANAAMKMGGDVNLFSGPAVICHYGVFQPVQVVTLLPALKVAFQAACNSLEAELAVEVGIGACFGPMLVGRFGSAQRCTFSALGAPAICSERLADHCGFNICGEFAAKISNSFRSPDPWISVGSHWKESPK